MSDHDHHHHHHHHHEEQLSFKQKAIKLIEHWIKHNVDHAATYSQWIETFKTENYLEAAEQLTEIAELTAQINIRLKTALAAVSDKPDSH